MSSASAGIAVNMHTMKNAGHPSAPCTSTRDAARAASAAYYANTTRFPTTFRELTAEPSPVLELGEAKLVNDTTVAGTGWTLTMSGGGTEQPTFTCDPST